MKEMSGVDRTCLHKAILYPEWERGRPNDWERWYRNWMDLRDLPCRSIQLLICLKLEAYRGRWDRWDRSNRFHLGRVIYNLPGTKDYQPGLP